MIRYCDQFLVMILFWKPLYLLCHKIPGTAVSEKVYNKPSLLILVKMRSLSILTQNKVRITREVNLKKIFCPHKYIGVSTWAHAILVLRVTMYMYMLMV